MYAINTLGAFLQKCVDIAQTTPLPLLIGLIVTNALAFSAFGYLLVFIVAPVPRPPRLSEKRYRTILPNGEISEYARLPCWEDSWLVRKLQARKENRVLEDPDAVQGASLFMSVVVPAYNEQDRLGGMLEEAVEFLQREYGDAHGADVESKSPSTSATYRKIAQEKNSETPETVRSKGQMKVGRGWEILIISDGSTDKTVEKAFDFARDHQLAQYPVPVPGPRTPHPTHATQIPHGSIRVVELEENRGKGGAVTHGMRHVRGEYVVFADADGASKFEDLAKLVKGCQDIEDDKGRGVAIGSRAHLVGSDAIVKRSILRNFLMHCFHLLIRSLTTRNTSLIKDTQCGFKLFSRPTLPYIIPHMHSEGWIFDVEMLMLAESAKITVVEVAIGWKEVMGSKLNVIWDSLGMAWGLAILRIAWAIGVYRR
ncbi:glycosyltransferase family 2 protein [Patellaria atrata CBS 101060]|uniref:dolichyl-phosphate beta-glucosyltransferase n=1 Tax=Patellaria atrata CBS 101060 TaxID=1346257 RepID=A0A9P4S5Y7_9PEZI|nr:glycosyltransferase family 2 protein [Patellaria atrata CBS 101060]